MEKVQGKKRMSDRQFLQVLFVLSIVAILVALTGCQSRRVVFSTLGTPPAVPTPVPTPIEEEPPPVEEPAPPSCEIYMGLLKCGTTCYKIKRGRFIERSCEVDEQHDGHHDEHDDDHDGHGHNNEHGDHDDHD